MDKLKHVPHRGLAANNIHHGAFRLGGQSGGGRNWTLAQRILRGRAGSSKSFVSNNPPFCFLGDTKKNKVKGKTGGHGAVKSPRSEESSLRAKISAASNTTYSFSRSTASW